MIRLHENHLKRDYFLSDFVEGLLIDSQSEFDENFRRTYGVLYERNAIVFSDYFQVKQKTRPLRNRRHETHQLISV
jgi:hypothetical protein